MTARHSRIFHLRVVVSTNATMEEQHFHMAALAGLVDAEIHLNESSLLRWHIEDQSDAHTAT